MSRVIILSGAGRDVLVERVRQVEVEHWTHQHDDEHGNRELAEAARSYVEHYVRREWVLSTYSDGAQRYQRFASPEDWPWDEGWWKPKDPRRDLIRAAALLIAEVERLDRISQHNQTLGVSPCESMSTPKK